MILLLTCPNDPSADLVAERLRARGARFVRYDDAQFPAASRIVVRYSNERGLTHELRVGDETIDLGDISAAWDHRPGPPSVPADLPEATRRRAVEQCQQFLDDVWRTLDCRWMPAQKDVVLRAQYKASQLKIAQAVGFDIPQTLMTNDPAEFRTFHRNLDGRIISKVFHRGVLLPEDDPGETSAFQCMTQIVSNREVGYAASIRFCPVIFQEYVPKALELRVTVVGRRVLAVAIHSQATNRTRHDWRHADLAHTRYRPYALPAEVETRCLALVERLGLCFGAIDLVLTPDGRYVFLEINPSGQWRWVEHLSGVPIADSIAELLIENDARLA